jgi:S-adenosylmethionine:tRNA ribosyltransferase-isomerase
MRVDQFDYPLSPELIAQYPLAERSASRMLHVGGGVGTPRDLAIGDLVSMLSPRDLLVLNDTRVIKARLLGRRDSGGRIELLVERVLGLQEAWALLRASHLPQVGGRLLFDAGVSAQVLERKEDRFRLCFHGAAGVLPMLERLGEVPLPPYITHTPNQQDAQRYQTIYARVPGAVAAPTAGLHFDARLLDAVRAAGVEVARVTLHVGAGTFQPLRVQEIADHRMHSEWYAIDQPTVDAVSACRDRGGRVLAVGTTTLRALESAAGSGTLLATSGDTDLFIVPGFTFRVVDRLLTNFHLPRSTLLMLVSAFGGVDAIRTAYRHAVRARYRFFSYGDAMLVERADAP